MKNLDPICCGISLLRLLGLLIAFAVSGGRAQGEQSVTVAWYPNPEPDLAGYIVRYGTTSGNHDTWIDAGNVTTQTVSGLAAGRTYFFVVTAYNTSGLESLPSGEVFYRLPRTNGDSSSPVPAVHLAFNETAGSTSPNGGYAGASFTFTVPVPQRTTNAAANVGGLGAIDLGTVAGNYAIDSDSILGALRGLDRFTLTGWLNNRSVVQGASGNRVLSCIDNGGDGFELIYKGDGSLILCVNQSPDSDAPRSSSGRIPADSSANQSNWRYFAVTYQADSGQVQFYFGSNAQDATLDVTRTYTGRGPVGPGLGRLSVGHMNPTSRGAYLSRIFRGLIDEVQTYDDVLSRSEIIDVQRRGGTSPSPPPPPRAGFSGSPMVGTAPLTLNFSDASSGTILSRYWDFGDGATTNGTGLAVTHTYSMAGIYTVALTVVGPGGSNTLTRVDYVMVSLPAPPVASLTGSPSSGQVPLTVNFTDTSTGPVSNRWWNLGDGQGRNNPTSSFTYTYNTAGTNTVSLVVEGPGGADILTRADYIVVTNAPPLLPPVAQFTATPTSGAARLVVTFTDNSTGSITNRSWSFGDGEGLNTTVSTFTRAYLAPGTNTVSLTVQGPGGTSTSSRAGLIVVTNSSAIQPIVKLNFEENSGLNSANTGAAGGYFILSTSFPRWDRNVPAGVGGNSSLDFGTSTGDFSADSWSVIGSLGGLTGFTLTGWLNNRSIVQGASGNRVLSCIDNGGDGFELIYKGDGSLILCVNQPPDSDSPRSSAGRIPADFSANQNNWRYFAVTYQADSGQVQFYFGSNAQDATLDVTRTYTGRGPVGPGLGRLSIGHMNPTSRGAYPSRIFRGLIDGVRIYGNVLSGPEIVRVQRDGDGAAAPAIQLTSRRASAPPAPSGPKAGGAEDSIPRITRVALESGRIRLHVSGSIGRSYRILTSSTLKDWTPIATNTTGWNGTFEFMDDGLPSWPARFYLVAEP